MTPTRDGNYMVATGGGKGASFMKITPMGITLWPTPLSFGNNTYGHSVATIQQLADGTFVVAGILSTRYIDPDFLFLMKVGETVLGVDDEGGALPLEMDLSQIQRPTEQEP
jgi:hypothetical protein